MGQNLSRSSEATVDVQNVGGIEDTSVTFSRGITLLVGRNATNRTSFLQAVTAALGSENVAIKGDADEAEVELALGGETYTRRLRRQGTSIVTDGQPYLDDPTVADLFAFLLESNEARRAVATGADLRELIMRPVDTEEIESEIQRLVRKRESITEELDEIDSLKQEIPDLEAEQTRLEDEIEETKADLEAKEAELETADADVEEAREGKSELESRFDDLRAKRSTLDDVRYDLETERESLEALKRERSELEGEEAELPDLPMGELQEVESEIRRLRGEKEQLEREINELQSVIGFNEEMLEDGASTAFDAPTADADADGDLTDQLLDDEELTCWTCGSQVEAEQVESTLAHLRDRSQSKVNEVSELEERIDELTSQKREFERAQREQDRIERRRSEIDDEVERGEANVERLQERREELMTDIEALEAEIEELEADEDNTILDLHKEANQLEYELGRLETNLEQVTAELEELETRVAEQDDLEAEREALNEEIEALRTKIERLERGAVEQFNEHMENVLGILDYANLDRIWLERVEREVREGRRKVSKGGFELHVVRTSSSGTTYQDTVGHLSESEREVTGLVFALAGYLTHEVYEAVPFILLDSLEAIDSDRIAALVEYLGEYTGYLLVALLPEDAAALPDDYERVTEI
ncbi:archaea-specific SMC-related protein [Haloglomus litoreum]|uniref:archaea-specific SMC-related protein n=1 Tax=Haloglomus litoreum TaxID=3034026 RepID=UPI0023E8D888|nr:archaea-specific SMC-related protein [Haloglomus sp. DT116]